MYNIYIEREREREMNAVISAGFLSPYISNKSETRIMNASVLKQDPKTVIKG